MPPCPRLRPHVSHPAKINLNAISPPSKERHRDQRHSRKSLYHFLYPCSHAPLTPRLATSLSASTSMDDAIYVSLSPSPPFSPQAARILSPSGPYGKRSNECCLRALPRPYQPQKKISAHASPRGHPALYARCKFVSALSRRDCAKRAIHPGIRNRPMCVGEYIHRLWGWLYAPLYVLVLHIQTSSPAARAYVKVHTAICALQDVRRSPSRCVSLVCL